MKKKIPTWLGAAILIVFTGIIGCCIWIVSQGCQEDYVAPAAENAGEKGNEAAICQSKEGTKMSLEEARAIAGKSSECGNKFKKENNCNENTGTWWIDLDLKKDGCNPACVVNVETKEAVVNWRCTGLIPKK